MHDIPVFVHGRRRGSVFELLGSKENNITYSVGWALAHSTSFRRRFAQAIGLPEDTFSEVRLQEAGNDGGFTDIELLGDHAHAIIEAKRGWWLPGDLQFHRYAPRLEASARSDTRFVAMSDCSATYASLHLPGEVAGVPLHYFGWRDLEEMTADGRTHAEKRLLEQLRIYLRTVATMQDPRSNMVYVVALSDHPARPDSSTTYIDVVEKHQTYFHPVGNRYPKEPPNYVGFRYRGHLQSIHHIESFVVSTNIGDHVPGCQGPDHIPHYVYKLGPAIKPSRPVRSGPIRDRHVRAAIDLLLTSATLVEAELKTKKRLASPTQDNGSLDT